MIGVEQLTNEELQAIVAAENPGQQPKSVDQLSNEELKILASGGSLPSFVAESQRGRTFAQGASFGFSEEIEAAVRSVLPESLGGGEYEQIRNELRKNLRDYKEQNGSESLGIELAGAFIPSILMSMTGIGATGAAANTARILKVAAGESALSAIGTSEANPISGQSLQDVALGTGTGAIVGTAAEKVTGKAGKLVRGLADFVRRKMKGADSAVQAELLRLVKATGLTVDEVISDVANGRIIADNATLSAAIKGMVNEGGDTAPAILSASGARRESTTAEAKKSINRALAPDIDDPNVLRARQATQDQLKEDTSDAYSKVFAKPESQAVTPEVSDQMLNIAQRSPDMRKELEQIYNAEGIVPLFKTLPDGSVEFNRMPTLEDAEGMRRVAKETTQSLYTENRGRLAGIVGRQEGGLREAIDSSAPALGKARAGYAGMKSQNEAFDIGQTKALTMDVDALEVLVGGKAAYEKAIQTGAFKGSRAAFDKKMGGRYLPEENLAAFRAGAMQALNNRARRSGTTLENMAKEDVQLGAAIRILLPENQAPQVLGDIGRAAEATSMDKILQPRAQSMTQALQREAKLRGSGVGMDDVARGLGGDPLAVAKLMMNMVPSAEGLSDRQMVEVVKMLYSESPELVERALKDNTVTGEMLKKLDVYAARVAKTARTAGSQQGAQIPGGTDSIPAKIGKFF